MDLRILEDPSFSQGPVYSASPKSVRHVGNKMLGRASAFGSSSFCRAAAVPPSPGTGIMGSRTTALVVVVRVHIVVVVVVVVVVANHSGAAAV